MPSSEVLVLGSTPLTARCLTFLVSRGVSVQRVIPTHQRPRDGRSRTGEAALDEVVQRLGLVVDNLDGLEDVIPGWGLSIGFGQIISQDVIDRFENGILNLHLAPLPWYRGALTSLSHAILDEAQEFGVTLHRIDAGIDTGPIYARRMFALPTDKTAGQLVDHLVDQAFALFADSIEGVLDGTLRPTPQPEWPGWSKSRSQLYLRNSLDGSSRLVPTGDLASLDRQVRALTRDGAPTPYFVAPNGNKIELRLADGSSD